MINCWNLKWLKHHLIFRIRLFSQLSIVAVVSYGMLQAETRSKQQYLCMSSSVILAV